MDKKQPNTQAIKKPKVIDEVIDNSKNKVQAQKVLTEEHTKNTPQGVVKTVTTTTTITTKKSSGENQPNSADVVNNAINYRKDLNKTEQSSKIRNSVPVTTGQKVTSTTSSNISKSIKDSSNSDNKTVLSTYVTGVTPESKYMNKRVTINNPGYVVNCYNLMNNWKVSVDQLLPNLLEKGDQIDDREFVQLVNNQALPKAEKILKNALKKERFLCRLDKLSPMGLFKKHEI